MFLFTPVLIAAAVIPAVMLLNYIRRIDRLESESPALIRRLVMNGLIATFLAGAAEMAGSAVLGVLLPNSTLIHDFLMYFVVVALSEEGFKYLLMKRSTWNSPEFNCMFDGVVYGVTVALGFAVFENIGYVLQFGLMTALVRAVTAIPGHASFGVFMGAMYGAAKRASIRGDEITSSKLRTQALVIPVLLHGFYDFVATGQNEICMIIFLVFIVVLFKKAKKMVQTLSAVDEYFG